HELHERGARRKADGAEALDVDRLRPERRNGIAQGGVEAADERGHPDDRRHADHDAEHGERGAHLVVPQRVERHGRGLGEQAEGLGEGRHGYSRLSASMGSRLAARRAGYQPKNRPTSAVMITPSATDQFSTDAGTGVSVPMIRANTAPLATPMMPPMS